MKRALAFGAATVCALGIVSSAFAAEETPIEAFYNVDESYTVTFPAEIEFDGYGDDQTVTVKAEGVFLNDGNKLEIIMVSTNGALKNGASSIAYTMTNGDGEEQTIVANTPFDILTVESGDRDGDTATLTFTSGDDTNVILAGKHSDTLTFNVEVASNPEIVTGSFTDTRDGKEYTTAEIAGKTWMTKNLAYAPEGKTWENDGIYVDEESGEVFYNWNAAQSICPDGWELPSGEDFENLIDIGSRPAWIVGALNINFAGNVSGTTGILTYDTSTYWTTTENEYYNDRAAYMTAGNNNAFVTYWFKADGHSVLCIAK